MLWHFKRHYHKLQFRHKATLAGVFIIGTMVSLFSSLFADSLPFQGNLTTLFSGAGFSTSNFSEVHFNQWGNNFAGIIFWLTEEVLSTPETITVDALSGWTQEISCSGHLRGLYYNNMRWRRLWPLDADSLAILSWEGSGYEIMTLTGGFYTNCTWISDYFPASNEIFGYIQHTRSGTTMEMVAGVDYDFTWNTLLSGAGFTDSLITTGWTYSGWLWDNYWGIAQVSSWEAPWDTAGMCDGFYLTPSTISTGNTISFTCSWHSITGSILTWYILHIFSWNTTVYVSGVYTNATTYTWTTGAALTPGNYTATCAVLHENGGPQCGSNIPFGVSSSSSNCSSNFQWNVTPANAYHFGGVMYYTNTSGNIIHISASEPVYYSITGNFLSAPLTDIFTGNFLNPISKTIYLTQNNWWNYITSTYNTWICPYTWSLVQIYRDTTAPTVPTLSSPISNANVCSTGSYTFSWSPASDTGHLSGYRYILQHASGTIYSDIVSNTITWVNLLTQNMLLWSYTWVVQAFDLVGNTSTSSAGTFTITPTICSQWTYGTGIQIIGALSSIINADLDTVYSSETFYIRWLTWSTLISVDLWTLIVNGTGIWTTGMITSTTPLTIELVSSDEYEDTVTSTITVAGITWTFSVTTKENSCDLSSDQEDTISDVYELLKDQYDSNDSLLNDFMATFQNILNDEVDISEDCSLEYLLELINDDYDNDDVDTNNHIAPNCKEYQISYNNSEEAYYSPMMRNRYYFINRETLIRHIDFYNAGDCHINTYGNVSWSDNRNTDSIHVAPNGKIYHMQSAGGGYTSSDFAWSKYFDSLSTMTSYIDSHNPVTNIWDHQVDRTFAPITYVAPNGKEYRIYKTNRWFMSYKLIKVRYFTSLAELQDHINRNNPAKK